MDGVLDRKFLGGGGVKKFPQQPDLTEQVHGALKVLSRNDNGFFLMVESGLIDKYAHLLDMDRAVYDVIMLDNAVKLARDWAAKRGDDTLILVVSDHSHPNSLVGTVNDDMSKESNLPLRERLGVYEKAGFPNYPAPDAEGYPSRIDVSRRLAIMSASLPDHYETLRPKLDNPNDPTEKGEEPGTFKANEKYKNAPGSMLRLGNLPAMMGASVHSGEDVILTATGPGSDRVKGSMDNTEVFRVMVDALGLAAEVASVFSLPQRAQPRSGRVARLRASSEHRDGWVVPHTRPSVERLTRPTGRPSPRAATLRLRNGSHWQQRTIKTKNGRDHSRPFSFISNRSATRRRGAWRRWRQRSLTAVQQRRDVANRDAAVLALGPSVWIFRYCSP